MAHFLYQSVNNFFEKQLWLKNVYEYEFYRNLHSFDSVYDLSAKLYLPEMMQICPKKILAQEL